MGHNDDPRPVTASNGEIPVQPVDRFGLIAAQVAAGFDVEHQGHPRMQTGVAANMACTVSALARQLADRT